MGGKICVEVGQGVWTRRFAQHFAADEAHGGPGGAEGICVCLAQFAWRYGIGLCFDYLVQDGILGRQTRNNLGLCTESFLGQNQLLLGLSDIEATTPFDLQRLQGILLLFQRLFILTGDDVLRFSGLSRKKQV